MTTLVNTTYEPEWRLANPRLTPLKVAIVRGFDGITARWWGTWFVAITEAVRLSAIRQLGISADRITVIPRGLQLDQISPPSADRVAALRSELGWDKFYPVVLSVGRLVAQKGHRYAIEAMASVAQTFPRGHLAVAGEGPLRGELARLAHMNGQADRVRFLGERKDVPALLAAADIFVFPSLFEGFGVALLEALGAGRACVVSRIPALTEVTDGGRVALLADPQSPEALATAIIRLAGDKELAARVGGEAATWVRARYDIIGSIRSLEALYETLASGSASPTGEVSIGLR